MIYDNVGSRVHNIGPKFIALNIELVLFTHGNSRTLEHSLFIHVSGRGTSATGEPEHDVVAITVMPKCVPAAGSGLGLETPSSEGQQ